MRILLVKTSSLGDVIHNLPVASDIARCLPGTVVDWCVEAPFAPLPRLHPYVSNIIPVALRRWRKHLLEGATWREIGDFRRQIKTDAYDLILDTQGLLKSAILARTARGPLHGYGADSAREPLASRFYDVCHAVPRNTHAVSRNRQLAALALGYADRLGTLPLDYGITPDQPDLPGLPDSFAILLTATSRDDKLWPEPHWMDLGRRLADRGVMSLLPSGSAVEEARARRIAAAIPGATALPRLDLKALAAILGHARLVVGVDTGLTHLAAALGRPVCALYTATDPGLTGVLGTAAYENLGGKAQVPPPDVVWESCRRLHPPLQAG